MTRKTVALPIVEKPSQNASILMPTKEASPVIRGVEDADLLCGSCGSVLVQGFSLAGIAAKFIVPAQMLIVCPDCGKHNRLPATVGN